LNAFVSLYGKKFPGACECLTKDRLLLFTYYDFPREHWIHILHDDRADPEDKDLCGYVGKCRHDPDLDSIDLHRSSQVPEVPSPVWPVNLETYRNAPL